MTTLERAKVPLAVVGWPLVVVPVVYVVFSALYGQITDDLPYSSNYTDVACVVLGGALLALGGARFVGALTAAIAAGLLTLTGLIVLIVVAARVGGSPYTGVTFYVNGSLSVLTAGVVTAGLALLTAQWSSPRPATPVATGQYGWAQYGGQSGYPPQYAPQPGYSPQPGYQQQYPQQASPQTGPQPQQQPYPQQQPSPQSGPQPIQPGYPQQQGQPPEQYGPPTPPQQYPQQPGQPGQQDPGQW